jgi:NAD(P)-dependent dehydrogenase (short-subunit alcohol dehydrogenase family)
MTATLTGRVALVTGGSRGVGAGIARRLGREGAVVAVNYRSDQAAAETIVAEIQAAGGTAAAYPASIDDADAVNAMVAAISSDLGAVDLLVSNAGTASRGKTVVDSEQAEFEQLMRVHTWGPLHLVRLLLPAMRQAERADVIVISSATVTDAPAYSAPYTVAKAALEMATRTLAREERAHGVRVNIVAPGLVDTDMGARLVRAVQDGARLDSLHADYPFGRVCQPDDVARVVAFLASDAASYMTGQRLTVDGGGNDPQIL